MILSGFIITKELLIKKVMEMRVFFAVLVSILTAVLVI